MTWSQQGEDEDKDEKAKDKDEKRREQYYKVLFFALITNIILKT